MKKAVIILCMVFIHFSFISIPDGMHSQDIELLVSKKLDSCDFNTKKLYGKVQLVANANQADIKVQIVNSFPDLKVKFVESFADQCGEWQIVEYGADLKVYITESFPDIKIQPVTSFPGI